MALVSNPDRFEIRRSDGTHRFAQAIGQVEQRRGRAPLLAGALLDVHEQVVVQNERAERERRLLEGLLLHAGSIAPREMLESRVFSFGDVGSNALEVYVSRLRKRLQGSGLHIRTFRGLGYRLEEAPT